VGNVINFGMKPNFIIAMYCLCIILLRPGFIKAGIIGLLAGAICQFFPGQPFLNFGSELIGALFMCLFAKTLAKLPPVFDTNPALRSVSVFASTFIATLTSGFSFVGLMYLLYYSGFNITPTPLAIFIGIIMGTATINGFIVTLLYLPLRAALPARLVSAKSPSPQGRG
jgi:hypothetical protein